MKLHNANDRLTKADTMVLEALYRLGPVPLSQIRQSTGVVTPFGSVKRLQECGYLLPKRRGMVGYALTDSGRDAIKYSTMPF